MATARNNSYSGGVGETTYIGLDGTQPQWVSNMADNTWALVPTSNTLNSLNPANSAATNPNGAGNTPPYGPSANSFANIISAWNGACFDQTNNKIWLPLQGGHADWYGNDVYSIDLNADSPTWIAEQPPSGWNDAAFNANDGQEATGLYSDGRVRSIHSYNKPVFIPSVGPAIAVQGRTSVLANAGTDRFIQFDNNGALSLFGAENTAPGDPSGGGSAYDASRNCVWWMFRDNARMTKYDVALNSWSTEGNPLAISGGGSVTYLDDLDLLVMTGSTAQFPGGIAVFDPVTNTRYLPGATGSLVGLSDLSSVGITYAKGRLYAWDNASNTTVINRITPPANPRTEPWVIDQQTVAAGNTVTPTVAQTNGTFGRFGWCENLGVFYLFNDTNELYAFKPE